MKLAVFDIDGTLVPCSTERAFGRYLARRGVLGMRQVLSFVMLGLRSAPTARAQTLKKNKGYLAGLEADEIGRLAESFVATELADALVSPVVQRLQNHLQQGDHVALLSGTLDAIACSLSARLGAHRAVGTVCEVRDGYFHAALPVMHPFGVEKRVQAEKLAAEFGVQPPDVFAYANSYDDLDLLRYAGTPVAVQPDRRLRRIALKNGWEILEDDHL